MTETFFEVQTIIVRLLGVDRSRVTLQARLMADLQADSLDLIELILIFEDALGVDIPIQDYRRIQSTVGEAVQYFHSRQLEAKSKEQTR